MAKELLDLQVSDHAKIAYNSLGPDDRRRVDSWFDHLRNWGNDEFIRSKARRLNSEEGIYVLPTSTDILIAFSIASDIVKIISIFRKDATSKFTIPAQRSAV
jgi:hypothetical protein